MRCGRLSDMATPQVPDRQDSPGETVSEERVARYIHVGHHGSAGPRGAAVTGQGDRFGPAEERQSGRGDPGAAAARGPAARGVDRPGGRPAAPRADLAPD